MAAPVQTSTKNPPSLCMVGRNDKKTARHRREATLFVEYWIYMSYSPEHQGRDLSHVDTWRKRIDQRGRDHWLCPASIVQWGRDLGLGPAIIG